MEKRCQQHVTLIVQLVLVGFSVSLVTYMSQACPIISAPRPFEPFGSERRFVYAFFCYSVGFRTPLMVLLLLGHFGQSHYAPMMRERSDEKMVGETTPKFHSAVTKVIRTRVTPKPPLTPHRFLTCFLFWGWWGSCCPLMLYNSVLIERDRKPPRRVV